MRVLWWAAIVAGASNCLASWSGWGGPAVIVWKGAGVALLALWAGSRATSVDGWLIAGVMALGALGDVLLDAAGMTVGATAFLAGHVLAAMLYARNRGIRLPVAQRAFGLAIAPATILAAVAIARGSDQMTAVTLYTTGLAVMAGMAWLSRFPVSRTGLGTLLFVASDLLIFARAGPLAGWFVPTLLVWPLYFAGQALIVTGVVRTLEKPPS
ncbi:MAG: lysoplasmalogenase family protein [Sphingomonas sp.]